MLDSSGNVFVVGSSEVGINGSDWLIINCSSAGLPMWTNYYRGPEEGNDAATDVAADASGNVIATGSSSSTNG